MKITKYGHCCLLIEEAGKRLLVDPGGMTVGAHPINDIDAVLITHEHFDHLHIPSVQAVLAANPEAKVYSIQTVAHLLQEEKLACDTVSHGQSFDVGGVAIETYGEDHAPIHPDLPPMYNTGFFVANRFFYPGDALTVPGKRPEILALPVAGPWMKLSDAVDYARQVKPDVCFPVHDVVVIEQLRGAAMAGRFESLLQPHGVRFEAIDGKGAVEF